MKQERINTVIPKPAEAIMNVEEVHAMIERKKLFWAQRKQLANSNSLNVVCHLRRFKGKFLVLYSQGSICFTVNTGNMNEEFKKDEAFPIKFKRRRFSSTKLNRLPYINP